MESSTGLRSEFELGKCFETCVAAVDRVWKKSIQILFASPVPDMTPLGKRLQEILMENTQMFVRRGMLLGLYAYSHAW